MTKTCKRKTLLILTFIVAVVLLLLAVCNPITAFAEEIQTLSSRFFPSIFDDSGGGNGGGGTITNQTGLGLGINVVTAEALNDFKTGYSILDNDKLQSLGKSSYSTYTSYSKTLSATTETELIVQYLNNVYFSGGFGLDSIGNLEANLLLGNSLVLENYSYKYYYLYTDYIQRYRLYINNYLNRDTYQDAFSEMFLNDLQLLKNEDITYRTFFDRYGTHLVGSAYYGGQLNFSFTVASNKVVINEDVKYCFDQSVSFPVEVDVMAKIKQVIEQELNVKYSSSDLTYQLGAIAFGGKSFSTSNINKCEEYYDKWKDSIDSDDDCVIVNYNSDGLVPLWYILPEEYTSLSNTMEQEYMQLCADRKSDFLDEFKTGNYTDFSGGTGGKDNPFIITEAKQLFNIPKISMDSNYKLANDIDLKNYNWTALGGFYNQEQFTGTFDGDGHTISNMTKTTNISEIGNRVYFGFFGVIGKGGCFKNVTFTGVNISTDGPENNNAKMRSFVGVVAGACDSGSVISNVTVVNSNVKFDCKTNGMSYVGGIVGLAYESVIEDCNNAATLVSGRYSAYVGGIAGFASFSKFYNCTNSGKLTAHGLAVFGRAGAGGIIGEMCKQETRISTCYNCNSTGSRTATAFGGKSLREDSCDPECANKAAYDYIVE